MSARGEYAKGVQRREEILEAALTVFARSGYQGTSLREVAEVTGMTPAGLLHYFGTREAMLTEVVRRKEELARATANGASVLPRMGRSLRMNADVPGLVRLQAVLAAQAADPEHPAHEYFVERYGGIRERLEADLRERIAARGLDLDATKVAAILIAVADGIQLQWMLDPSIGMADHFDYLLAALGLDATDDDS
ncbi:TetR/AcrR family transcriptional regulator [Microbacterium sp. SLBN-146]|uniref:TetR/AcrR family transcriptional regulator n=1 Tax=Microbacterium sp. SLBN-146 TaxID=2768457 RepID=UPI0011510613|nr:TetR/AcrR family transcriptional regulator [Microbacterium sp. SLBN-146]TQJ29888.1 TetR family transcriptional regulator [Microbacterium sp. SLBN-146]